MIMNEGVEVSERGFNVSRKAICKSLSLLEEGLVAWNIRGLDLQNLREVVELLELGCIRAAGILHKVHSSGCVKILQILSFEEILWTSMFIPENNFGIVVFILLEQDAASFVYLVVVLRANRFSVHSNHIFFVENTFG